MITMGLVSLIMLVIILGNRFIPWKLLCVKLDMHVRPNKDKYVVGLPPTGVCPRCNCNVRQHAGNGQWNKTT